MRDIDLTQELIAKYCHDLSGILGAIDSGVEFLQMNDDKTRDKALSLLRSSAEQAVVRLRFYRKAYGVVKQAGEANLKEINLLCRAFLDKKIELIFAETYFNNPSLYICDSTGKIIMCLIEVAATALIYGGLIKVEITKFGQGKKVAVIASGRQLRIDQEKYDILCGLYDDVALSPVNVHYYYTARLASKINSQIKINAAANQIEFSFS